MSAKFTHFLFFTGAVIFFFSAAYLDLTLRARSAYLEGEKYMAWAKEPALKKDFFENTFSAGLTALKNGRMEEGGRGDGFEDKKNLLLAEKNFKIGESSAKYAYIWYRTAGTDFSPPVTHWAGLARQKTPAALALWRAELALEGTRFDDNMLGVARPEPTANHVRQ
ncbi:MAG: hypothetical protein A2X28_08315 [Elusimicrobia bacterium GWA2_56_46]|nr:MAG: hypothetical protein A2X28_08315 [Elusimicrobia bacterium GWA2_56_46]OGR55145.1 MAG: hypothetical protein A2X39_01220 [Elusimicrobia bacterium GWC2_56_31]HBB68351.1 hypothetical protein [Elusimicrobiota bacterium]HBW23676.1 hypothetical protein [Elusimicrobiota bacterium]